MASREEDRAPRQRESVRKAWELGVFGEQHGNVPVPSATCPLGCPVYTWILMVFSTLSTQNRHGDICPGTCLFPARSPPGHPGLLYLLCPVILEWQLV